MLRFLLELPFRLLGALLMFVAQRRIVPTRRTDLMVVFLKSELKDKQKFPQANSLSDAVLLIIAHEALRRAAEKEKDGRARLGEFYRQLKIAAKEIIAAFAGKEAADPRIKNILIFNRVL